jgi:cystathionine beta-lyase
VNNARKAREADNFNFDRIVDRTDTDSTKWQRYGEDVLPMWVADMDFRSPPGVIEALHERVEHGVFGYPQIPEDLREIIAERLRQLYDWEVSPEAITFLPGIVPGFNQAAQALVPSQEGLMIQTPVYMHILHAAEVAGVHGSAMELTREADGRYTIDFDLFERTIEEPEARTRMFLLCNPHNPVGRVFTRDELEQMAEICLRHDLFICSDEIHCDLIFDDHHHIPIAALSPEIEEKTITLMAPSKTFNIAGLHCGFAVIPNTKLRRRYRKAGKGLMGTPNLLGYTAAQAAYLEGQAWLDELLIYLEDNRDVAVDYVREHLPELHVTAPEGTFLAWIDCRDADLPVSPHRFFLEEAKVALNEGAAFGPGGEGFVRLNFGCPRDLLMQGLERIRHALE